MASGFGGNPGERKGGGGGNPAYNRNPTSGNGGGTPTGRASRTDRGKVIHTAVTSLASALENSDPGVKGAQALNFARLILSRPGVSLGRGGNIFYQGQRYAPAAFAASPLAKLATGQTAAAQNQAAITGDPDYINALAQLGLQRDQATAGLSDQQRQALIQFGDPTFAGGDAQTAAEASTNPFSTERLQAQQFQQNTAAQAAKANQLGVGAGGGAIAGKEAAQQAYAAQTQDAVTKISALLASIQQQQAAAQQAYGVGQSTAATDAYNALLASGAIHAAQPPAWSIGTFKVRPPSGGAAGSGGGNTGVPGFGAPPGERPGGGGGNPTLLPPHAPGPPGWRGTAPAPIGPAPLPGNPIAGGNYPGNMATPTAADVLRRFGISG